MIATLRNEEKRNQRVTTYLTDAVYQKLKLQALRQNTSVSCVVHECIVNGTNIMEGDKE